MNRRSAQWLVLVIGVSVCLFGSYVAVREALLAGPVVTAAEVALVTVATLVALAPVALTFTARRSRPEPGANATT
ncbi:hypothetical protein [Halobaculum sp. P14]|uniref:hypothetical protein n=1 Tax=Halobaculum sp. P14 TaxID=3421638 RepID=UPI003EC0A8E1